MHFPRHLVASLTILATITFAQIEPSAAQFPLHPLEQTHQDAPLSASRNISVALFAELEELARLVDISYCVGLTGLGISKPFGCLSRCADFPDLELVTAWNTGAFLSDSCGYIALDHAKQRIVVAFRGTYSIANTVIDLSTVPQKYVPYPGEDDEEKMNDHVDSRDNHETSGPVLIQAKCKNCTVHMGFNRAWRHTRDAILPHLLPLVDLYPHYQVNLVGHSLGGAVAALAGLDFHARGWHPLVTTFGEPRIGNVGLARYVDAIFGLSSSDASHANDEALDHAERLQYRRVTHVDDPVPLLPLTEWGYAMHAGEIHITKSSLSPDIQDLRSCIGDNDQTCIAGQDSGTAPADNEDEQPVVQKRGLLASVRHELDDVMVEPWGIPSRYKLWQLFFAHRDYFWRLGLCVPGGDPLGGGRKYEGPELKDDL